uniref:Solute carrier family 19 member 3b n=1 Tax=Sander lucioperca TaxID=283035 RepID=A0A8D0AE76_SANLU
CLIKGSLSPRSSHPGSILYWAKLKSSSWAYPTAVLSLYGFFANCRVAEPFLTPYLIGPHKNISGEVVSMADTYILLCHLLWQSFRESYSSRDLIYWSVWWALATAGYVQVFNYIQLMWDHIEPSATSSIYNGGVEAVCSLVGAAAAFSVGHIKVSWAVWGELALGLFSAVGTGAVFLMALTSSIWACYAAYVIFKSCYMLLITITTFQIASNLSMQCYALTFGINTFVALSLQTIITVIVVDEAALGLDIVTQFIIYGSYYAVISVLFLIRGTYTACINQCNPEHTETKEQESGVVVISAERF